MKNRSGYLLLSVIALGALLFAISLAMTRLLAQDANLYNFEESSLRARVAADSGISQSLSVLIANPEARDSLDGTLPDGSSFTVTFDQASAMRSVSNLDGDSALEVDGRTLPTGTILLRSEGVHRTQKVVSHAIISLGTPVLREDFNALIDLSSGADGWESSRPGLAVVLLGQWVVDVTLGQRGVLAGGQADWRNYELRTRATLSQGSGVSFYVRLGENLEDPTGYEVGYSLLEQPLALGTFFIKRVENGQAKPLAEKNGRDLGLGGLAWLLGLSHQYSVVVEDDTISLSVDGRQLLEATDEDPIPAGRIGLSPGLNTLLLVDELEVRTLTEVRSRWRS